MGEDRVKDLGSEWFEVPSLLPTFGTDGTAARCFDVRGVEFLTVAWGTGLLRFKIMQDGDRVFYSVDPACLPECHYVFDGVIWTDEYIDQSRTLINVHSEGDSDGSGYEPTSVEGSPWQLDDSLELYASYQEWCDRLDACRKCKQYDHALGVCKVEKVSVAWWANRARVKCPKGVWGVSELWDEVEFQRRQDAYSASLTPDQDDFEAEWEARNAG